MKIMQAICFIVLIPSIICSQGFSSGGTLPGVVRAQSAVDNEG